MRTPSSTHTNPVAVKVTLHLPSLDDATAVILYNFLCELVDHFDTHYGEQICRFYSRQDANRTNLPPPNNPDDPPF